MVYGDEQSQLIRQYEIQCERMEKGLESITFKLNSLDRFVRVSIIDLF